MPSHTQPASRRAPSRSVSVGLANGGDACPDAVWEASAMTRDQLVDDLRTAAADPVAMQARTDLLQLLTPALEQLGQLLRVAGHLFGDQRANGSSTVGNGNDHLVALGYLSSTAAELVRSADLLHRTDSIYACSALTRQLVEVEYLAWAFAEEPDEAADWLRAGRAERVRRWTPRHLYSKSQGRFRSTDYHEHCETGGHPTPVGARTLLAPSRHPDRAFAGHMTKYELVLHAESTWNYLLAAVVTTLTAYAPDTDPTVLVPAGAVLPAIHAAAATWRSSESVSAKYARLTANQEQQADAQ